MKSTPTKTWHGAATGQRVVMLVATQGANADDQEAKHPVGALAFVSAVADFGSYQGYGVNLVVGEGEHAICNSFDDRDVIELGHMPFKAI